MPDFTVAAIMNRLQLQKPLANPPVPAILIDAMSTGNDLLPFAYQSPAQAGDATGGFRLWQAATTSWATLYVSRIVDSGPNVGADIIGYYFENPGFPSQLRQGIYQEVIRADYRGGDVPAPPTANILALDVAMGLIETNRGRIEAGVLASVNKLYFSLTNESATALQNSGAVTHPSGLDGATIFVANYAYDGTVTSVSVHLSRSELNLPAGVDIDALGVGTVSVPVTVTGTQFTPLLQHSFLYVISAGETGGVSHLPEELYVVGTPQDPPPPNQNRVRAPLRTATGQILVGPGGVLPGRVKGVCAQDPDTATGTRAYGVPKIDAFGQRLGLSLTARTKGPISGALTDQFHLSGVLSGWLRPGPSTVYLVVTHLNAPVTSPPTDPYHIYNLPLRQATDDNYEFALTLNFPWAQAMQSNDYEIFVTTTPWMSPPGSPLDFSITSMLKRFP
jgi:hypothetical protein